MSTIIAHVTGIYPYSRKHSLAARRFGRGSISKEDLLKIQVEDSRLFVSKQKELGLDFVSDGQFLWMDYARPFALTNNRIAEENLEMVRRSDTNTFIRRPKVDELNELKNIDLKNFMLPIEIENRSLKVYGPYTFSKLAVFNGFSTEKIMEIHAEALAKTVNDLNLSYLEIAEPALVEHLPTKDLLEQTKSCIETITKDLNGTETNLSLPFNSPQPIWENILDFPVKGLTVDMRSRDYFNIIPQAEEIVSNHNFIFDYDIQKKLVLGCVNGRNGGLTPGMGLETSEWIVQVVNLVKDKTSTPLGITFSADEVLVPRKVADKKLESIAKAKQILGGG
ncbi:MAG: hypothetical protein ABIJ92_04855 [Candidatus Aenigmatarchaeota archaeon]